MKRRHSTTPTRIHPSRDLVARLHGGPAQVARAIRGLTRSQMQRRPTRGKWSILEIVGHLHDTEFVYGYRWRLMAAQSGAPILGYDQDRWARELRHQGADPARLLREIAVLREATMGVVERIPKREWARLYGHHSERGEETLLGSMEHLAAHDTDHIAQIQHIRERYGW